MSNRLNRSAAGNGILFLLMAVCGAFMALPLVMIANNAIKPLDEIFRYPPALFARNPTLENFTDLFVLMGDSVIPFTRHMANTFVITASGTVGHIICASIAAYPLSKHEFIGKKALFSIIVLSMMFSATVTQIPNYMIVTWLGLNNTQWALILPAFSYGVGVYLMKQFMEQMPDSLMESARLDGAGEWRILFAIVMPNVKPAWLTLAVFQFQAMWGNTGGMFIRDDAKRPLQAIIQQITAGGAARAGASAAVGFILAAVPIAVFLFCQSSVMETMTTSGMKE
jgi:ABC-type glycerol-3-phosphate transport system permease component